jgi:hypothetical protein
MDAQRTVVGDQATRVTELETFAKRLAVRVEDRNLRQLLLPDAASAAALAHARIPIAHQLLHPLMMWS